MSALDEFQQIARLFRPLTRAAPEALNLLDDAAVIASRPGFDLVITKDALVADVHFRVDDPPEIVAQRLMRANLSDLAAKGAEPYGYLLMTAWSPDYGWDQRQAFARGLDLDGATFGVVLLGGDTVSTPGPLTVSMTLLGWVPHGTMIRRGGAQPGDQVLVSGPIGDGYLDWAFGAGELDRRWLPSGHRLPRPRLDLRATLRDHARSAADISDGLVADAGHLGRASGVGICLDLDLMPLSTSGRAWLDAQADPALALVRLATGGDDYEIVCTVAPDQPVPEGFTRVGRVTEGEGVEVRVSGVIVDPGDGGWRHR